MSLQAYEIEELIARYISEQALTEREQEALNEWLRKEENRQLFDELIDKNTWDPHLKDINFYKSRQSEAKKKLDSLLLMSVPVVPVKKLWIKYVVAASVVAVVATGSIYLLTRPKQKIVQQTKPVPAIVQDVPPGGDKAILTLGDGSTVVLEDAQNGVIRTEENTEIVKRDGELKYEVKGQHGEVSYNKLVTQRGGQYRLTLPDGSLAVLNAASSIRYPVAFTGAERKVEVTGEVYFEVVKNAKKPFLVDVIQDAVKGNEAEVRVLGTHFNVNAYKDEPMVKTTLVEGSVKVSSVANQQSAMLQPGQQGQLNDRGNIAVKKVNVDEVTAWKDGKFRFSDADLKAIMRQVSRWYDVDVKFAANVNPSYGFILNRNMPVSKIIDVLEESGGAHFRIEGKVITVLP